MKGCGMQTEGALSIYWIIENVMFVIEMEENTRMIGLISLV